MAQVESDPKVTSTLAPQCGQMTLKDEAEWMAYQLRHHVASVEDAIAWADHHIETLDRPPYELIEISMHTERQCLFRSARKNLRGDVWRLLKKFPGELDRNAARAAFFASMHQKLISEPEQMFSIGGILYAMACDGDVPSAEARKWIVRWLDAWDADRAEAPGEEEMRSGLLTFLETESRLRRS